MTAPETPADDTTSQPPADESQPHEQTPDEPSPNSEAARWRVKLRETEAERDALADKVAGYQRRDCEAVVADLLEVPADLWDIARADVADFFNEDGTVNEDEIRAAAGLLLDQRPGLAKTEQREPAPKQWGQYSGNPPGRVGWESVIGGRL